jgi:hypothetical protein
MPSLNRKYVRRNLIYFSKKFDFWQKVRLIHNLTFRWLAMLPTFWNCSV